MSTDHNPRHTTVVGCLVRNEQNQVLLIKHYKRGWEIPQGRVEEGENLLDALRREVREEAGVEIVPGPLAAVWSMLTPPSAIIFTFLGRCAGGALGCSDDSVGAAWFTEEKALELVTGAVMHDRLRVLLQYNHAPVYLAYTTRPYHVQMKAPLGL